MKTFWIDWIIEGVNQKETFAMVSACNKDEGDHNPYKNIQEGHE